MANKEKVSTEEKNEVNVFNIAPYIGVAIVVFILVLTAYVGNFYDHPVSNDSGDWGTFGDFMGGILNPTLAFCSFLALLKTIRIQSKELNNSTLELAKSSQALEDQSNSLIIQNFENTFFNMINLHNEIINNIKIEGSLSTEELVHNMDSQTRIIKPTFIKKEAIKVILNNLNDFSYRDEHKYRKFNKVYDLFHDKYQNIVGHYFGNIYQILKFISTNKYINDKKKYSDLFRAQFSSNELELLFYHCTGSIGSKKFKHYLKEFGFLEHLAIEKRNDNFKFILATSVYHRDTFEKNNKIDDMIKSSTERLHQLKKAYQDKESNYQSDNYFLLAKILFDLKEYNHALKLLDIIKLKTKEKIEKLDFNSTNGYLKDMFSTAEVMINDIQEERSINKLI